MGFIFYATATWSPHGLNFPHPPAIGGRIWDETGENALVTRYEKWRDAPRDEQACIQSMARGIAVGLADDAVARCELRRDAMMCSVWSVHFLIRSAIDSSESSAALAAAANARRRIRSYSACVLSAACRRVTCRRVYGAKMVTMPSVPRACNRLAVAVQVRRSPLRF